MATPATAAAKGSSRRDRILDSLQTRIVDGEYPAGTRLTQPQLAREYGVSQGAIRECLIELKARGLVQLRQNLGASVLGLDVDRVRQLLELREALEGMAARLCCQHASRAQLAPLRLLAQRQYELAQAGDETAMRACDREFHTRLVHACGNRILAQCMEDLGVQVRRLRLSRDQKEVRDEHLRLLDAIEGNRPDEAEAGVRTHLRATQSVLAQEVAAGHIVPRPER
jgi:DNA-binding GntR family transcriptional regulator